MSGGPGAVFAATDVGHGTVQVTGVVTAVLNSVTSNPGFVARLQRKQKKSVRA